MEVICRLGIILAEENMQLKELAAKIPIDYKHLSAIKTGRTLPNIRTALIIAEGVGRPINEIWVIKK